ncbi:MAG: hypothetical protein D6722_28410, partial [Bacteroidetes bacterium]
PGEKARVFQMGTLIFLIITTLLLVKPAVTALFISRYGVEELPIAYVLVALVAMLVSWVYTWVLERYSLRKVFRGTLLLSAGLVILLGGLLRLGLLAGGVLYFFYLWVSLFGVLAASQFWILANLVFNVREAKRLFGLIGAGAIAGGIFGGYLASALANLVASENLLFLAAGALLAALPLHERIWRRSIPAGQAHFVQQKRVGSVSDQPFALIRRSPLLRFLAALVGISVVVAKLVDYQFSAVAAEAIPDLDDLTAFFGFWLSTLNVISLLTQLFFTRRVVGVLGVGRSLLFLPGGIFVGGLLFLLFPALWSAALMRAFDGSLKQSINKAAVELLSLPIPPEVKQRTKTFIDVFIDSLATGLSGLMLIFIVRGLDLGPVAVTILVMLLLLAWLWLARGLSQAYLRAFRVRLAQNQDPQHPHIPHLNHASILDDLRLVLTGADHPQQLYILRRLQSLQDNRLLPEVRALLQSASGEVRAEAIRTLYALPGPAETEHLLPLIFDPEQAVRIEAFEYLIGRSGVEVQTWLTPYLEADEPAIRQAALQSLAACSRRNPELGASFHLEGRVRTALEGRAQDPDSYRYALGAIGQGRLDVFWPELLTAFQDTDASVAQAAAMAMGAALDADFVDPLLAGLGRPVVQEAVIQALSLYGDGLIPRLQEILGSGDYSLDQKRAIPAVLQGIGGQTAANLLFRLIQRKELGLRQEAARALFELKLKQPYLQVDRKAVISQIMEEVQLYQQTLAVLYAQTQQLPTQPQDARSVARQQLVQLLEERLDSNLERIFRLLGLHYPPEDIQEVYRGIQSPQHEQRVSALEYLDNLLAPLLKRVLIPIFETALLDTITED